MKDEKNTIFTLEKLYIAYRACLKGKRNTANALKFEYNREQNLYDLLEDLQKRTYTISRHIYFIVTNPTPREIFAADFRDRIVHHLLCTEIQQVFECDFIERSYANRIGKGTHCAVRQLQQDLRCVRREYPDGKYYLKLDIENFFRSIDHTRLYRLIEYRLRALPEAERGVGSPRWREEVLWLAQLIIFHEPTTNYVYRGDPDKRQLIPAHKSLFSGQKGAGLPIGNLTSQFFANVYLHELDLFITKTLGQRSYLRYVDDFVLTDTNRVALLTLRDPIDVFLKETLGLRLHPKKTVCQAGGRGVNFLGYIVRANYILVRQSVVKRLRQRLRIYDRQYASCYEPAHPERVLQAKNLQATVASYLGHFSHAQSFRLSQRIRTTYLQDEE